MTHVFLQKEEKGMYFHSQNQKEKMVNLSEIMSPVILIKGANPTMLLHPFHLNNKGFAYHNYFF